MKVEDGWVKEEENNNTFIPDDYDIFYYGDRNLNSVLSIILSLSDQFIPTLSQLIALEEAGFLELEVDGYWDTDTVNKVASESQVYELILLRR